MNHLLWRSAAAAEGDELSDAIMGFMTGEGILDRAIPRDLRATVAHVRGLQRIKILTQEDERLCKLLDELQRFLCRSFCPDRRFEDGHSAIRRIYMKVRDLGDRVHAGRMQ
jgi:argininosuccinate lyase